MTDTRSVVERAMGRADAPSFTFDTFQARRERRHRNQRIAAAVIATAVFLVPIWFVARADGDPSATPGGSGSPTSTQDEPGVLLPLEDSASGTPAHAGLVAWMDARPGSGFPQRFVPVHQVWVYADGRVISRHELPLVTQGRVSPLVERRLTPQGLEFLRSQLASTGLFRPGATYQSRAGLAWGSAGLDVGGRWTLISWCCPDGHAARTSGALSIEQADDLVRISDGLADLEAWLPAGAWVDPTSALYEPARVAVCYWGGGGDPLEPAVALSALPPAVQELLRGEVRKFDAAWTTIRADGFSYGPYVCSEIPLGEVSVVDALLKESGAEPLPEHSPSSGGYVLDAGGTIGELMVTFEPILPHGEWSIMGG